MQGIIRFCKYLGYILKDTFMIISISLDILGIVITYLTNFEIPDYIYIIILIIGFILSNYRIYVDNAPDINISTSLIRKNPFKSLHYDESKIKFMVNYNLYISNDGNNVGIIEDVKVELIGFSDIKDEFLLSKVGIGFSEFFIANEEVFTPLEFMKSKVEAEFPILVGPKKTIKKILIIYIEIAEANKADYLKTIEWMNDIEFSLKVMTKNNNIEKNNSYKIVVAKNSIEDFIDAEYKLNQELDEYYERSNKSIL